MMDEERIARAVAIKLGAATFERGDRVMVGDMKGIVVDRASSYTNRSDLVAVVLDRNNGSRLHYYRDRVILDTSDPVK